MAGTVLPGTGTIKFYNDFKLTIPLPGSDGQDQPSAKKRKLNEEAETAAILKRHLFLYSSVNYIDNRPAVVNMLNETGQLYSGNVCYLPCTDEFSGINTKAKFHLMERYGGKRLTDYETPDLCNFLPYEKLDGLCRSDIPFTLASNGNSFTMQEKNYTLIILSDWPVAALYGDNHRFQSHFHAIDIEQLAGKWVVVNPSEDCMHAIRKRKDDKLIGVPLVMLTEEQQLSYEKQNLLRPLVDIVREELILDVRSAFADRLMSYTEVASYGTYTRMKTALNQACTDEAMDIDTEEILSRLSSFYTDENDMWKK